MTTPLQQAIAAMRAGKKTDARRLLARIVMAERKNLEAWYLLSYVAETKEQRVDCLHKVLALNPTHAEARKRLATLDAVPSSQQEPQKELVMEGQPNIGAAQQARTLENKVVTSSQDAIIPTSTAPSKPVLDELVEQWLAVLTFRERKVLEYLYLIEENRFSVAAIGRIISVSTEEVNQMHRRAFAKLREESSCVIAEPILSPLFGLLQASGESIGESELGAELKRELVVQEIDPFGVARLILALQKDVDKENTSKSKDKKAKRSQSAGNCTAKKEITVRVTASGKDKKFIMEVSKQPYLTDKQLSLWKEDKTLVEELNLSRRSFNALKRAGINTIGQLVALYPEQIWVVKNIGAKSLEELEKQLGAYIAENQPPVPSVPQSNESEQMDSTLETVVLVQSNQTEALNEIFLPLIHDKTSIDALNLSRRTFNAVFRSGISTVSQLVSLSLERLWQIKNIGEKAVQEIETQLEVYLAENAQLLHSSPSTVEPTPLSRAPAVDPELLDRLAAIPLNEISIERLGLSEVANRGLNRQGISSIEQLLQHGEKLVSDGKIGEPLKRYLAWLVEQDEEVWADEIAGKGISPLHKLTLASTSLEELVNQWLNALRERGRQIIRWRHGLDDEPQTLQEIGERLGITRERVRQLEKRALRKLQSSYNGHARDVFRPLMALLRHKLAENGGLLSHSEVSSWIETENSIRAGHINPLEAISLICQMDTQFHSLPKQQTIALSAYSADSITEIQEAFASILSEKLTPTSGEDLFDEFKQTEMYRIFQDWPEVYPDNFILACLRVHPELEQLDSGLYTPAKWSKKRLGAIIAAMREIGEPAHYSAITQKANSLLPPDQRFTARAIHARLGQYPDIFVWVRLKGTYGLKEWGLEQGLSYVDGLAQILEDAGYPLTLDQIMTRLPAVRQYFDESSVVLTLGTHERFCSLPNNTYGLAEWTDKLSQTDFGDLFGNQLTLWQIEFDKQSGRSAEISTQNEVDAIRSIGLDFFVD